MAKIKANQGVTKGIILAGGAGTRLYPLTLIASKQLQPVYDKPMIYYPLASLMYAGIQDILIISTPHDLPRFKALLGNGHNIGVNFSYAEQAKPAGIAEAFIIAEEFIDNANVALILGDNLFYGMLNLPQICGGFENGACIFGYPVKDPERYGVIEFGKNGKVLGIEEKPKTPKSQYAVPGLYLYDNKVAAMAKKLKPSPRGELEITDLNLAYLKKGQLRASRLGRGIAWLDTGTHDSLLDAGVFIAAIESRQSTKIGCIEEVAYRKGFIDDKGMDAIIKKMPKSPYRDYLRMVRDEKVEWENK